MLSLAKLKGSGECLFHVKLIFTNSSVLTSQGQRRITYATRLIILLVITQFIIIISDEPDEYNNNMKMVIDDPLRTFCVQ